MYMKSIDMIVKIYIYVFVLNKYKYDNYKFAK